MILLMFTCFNRNYYHKQNNKSSWHGISIDFTDYSQTINISSNAIEIDSIQSSIKTKIYQKQQPHPQIHISKQFLNQNQKKNVSNFDLLLICCIIYYVFVVKKSGGYIIAAFLMALGIAGPLALKALAAIAGKALIISKVALTIAGIIALKKIFSSGHHDGRSFNEMLNMPNSIFVDDDNNSNVQSVIDPYRYHLRAKNE